MDSWFMKEERSTSERVPSKEETLCGRLTSIRKGDTGRIGYKTMAHHWQFPIAYKQEAYMEGYKGVAMAEISCMSNCEQDKATLTVLQSFRRAPECGQRSGG